MSQQMHPEAKAAFITGITGQDGSYLAELLLAKGYEVHGLVRRSSHSNLERIAPLLCSSNDSSNRLFLHYGDLADSHTIRSLLEQIRPHEVYNLAAQSHVQVSFDHPEYTTDITAMGVVRILEAIKDIGLICRFYQASSSEIFGVAKEFPQNEHTPFNPQSPYAKAKVYAHEFTRNYRETHGIFAVNGILYNHESPRRSESFVTRKITRAVARMKHGLQDKLSLGNLDAERDWGFAGDYVNAMWLMLQTEKPEDYVIATGESHSVKEFLQNAASEAGIDLEGRIEIDERFLRPTDVKILVGDAGKARRKLGWKPEVTLHELVSRMVKADLKIAEEEASLLDPKPQEKS